MGTDDIFKINVTCGFVKFVRTKPAFTRNRFQVEVNYIVHDGGQQPRIREFAGLRPCRPGNERRSGRRYELRHLTIHEFRPLIHQHERTSVYLPRGWWAQETKVRAVV